MTRQVVFLCGARDYHAIDWYRSSVKLITSPKPIILTDLIQAEGFSKLISSSDRVHKLLILDPLLLPFQGSLANVWRNLLKLLVFPLQVLLLHSFARQHPCSIYYAHSMYYICLASAARLSFVGQPQGSEILIRARKSLLYRFFSKVAMRSARLITVDSTDMANIISQTTGIRPLIIQNGIDTTAIAKITSYPEHTTNQPASRILSARGLTPLYQIDQVLSARNRSCLYGTLGLDIVYPFYDEAYRDLILQELKPSDRILGRLSHTKLYQLYQQSLLFVSIPSSDSSPRSVYEAIFCGCIVAVSPHGYVNSLPESMLSRLFIVDLTCPTWLDDAISFALSQQSVPFVPCSDALLRFDQVESFMTLYNHTLSCI